MTRLPAARRLFMVGAVVVAALGTVVAPVRPDAAHALANGTPVADGQYLFSTKLTMTNIPNPDGTVRNSACSGALIAPQWVITAGHCFHDVSGNRVSGPVPYPTTATLGKVDLADTGGHVIDVVEVRQASGPDISLARLATPVTDIAPLPVGTKAPQIGTIVRMTGWGATSSINPTPVTHLQTGQFRITRVARNTILVVGFAPASNTSACLWDSGAPYFIENPDGTQTLVSVESDGPPCPHAQEETTARVDRIAGWIAQTTGGLSAQRLGPGA